MTDNTSRTADNIKFYTGLTLLVFGVAVLGLIIFG